MPQTDAYGAGRGLTLRLADPRRRRSRAVLLKPTLARKKQLVRRQRVQPRPLLPNTTRTVAYTHASTAAAATKGCHPHNTTGLPQDGVESTPGSVDDTSGRGVDTSGRGVDDADARGDPRRTPARRPEERRSARAPGGGVGPPGQGRRATPPLRAGSRGTPRQTFGGIDQRLLARRSPSAGPHPGRVTATEGDRGSDRRVRRAGRAPCC